MSTPRVTLTVHLLDDGNVQVAGPIHDKVLCCGLLTLATNAVLAFQPKELPRIIPAATLPGNGRAG